MASSPSRVQQIIQQIAAMQPVSSTLAYGLHHLDRAVLRLSNRRFTLTSLLAGVPVVFLTTTGAKSGLTRTVPLLAIQDPRQPAVLVLLASNWGQKHYPAWYFNLKAHPQAQVEWNGRVKHYQAREAQGAEYDTLWQRATATYSGFRSYKQRTSHRHIPIMVLEPVE